MPTKRIFIIGSGAAGSALAFRLSSSPSNEVILLESGQDQRPPAVSDPAAWPTTLGSDIDFGYVTEVQPALNGRSIDYPRGRVLGGTTCLNAMIHMRPNLTQVAAWGRAWSADHVVQILTALESHRPPTNTSRVYRGTTGPVHNGPARATNALCAAFVKAAVARGYGEIADVNYPHERIIDASGAGWYDLCIQPEGSRADAASTYLRPFRDRPNLKIQTGWRVERLELSPAGDVLAIVGQETDTEQVLSVSAEDEVVLCAGAIDSPAILLRSGIGPAENLAKVGITSKIDLPGVGENLHDHPAVPVVWSSEQELDPPRAQFFESVLALYQHPHLAGRSALASFGHLAYLPPDVTPPAHGATALIGLLDPHSRGSVRLDPHAPDRRVMIDPGLLSDTSDVTVLATMLSIVRRLASSDALSPYGLGEILPGPSVADSDLEAYVRAATGTYFHPVGTCRTGEDAGAVTDLQLRVRGTRNLRVADASVIPTIPAAATSVTAQLIGWRAAEFIDSEMSTTRSAPLTTRRRSVAS